MKEEFSLPGRNSLKAHLLGVVLSIAASPALASEAQYRGIIHPRVPQLTLPYPFEKFAPTEEKEKAIDDRISSIVELLSASETIDLDKATKIADQLKSKEHSFFGQPRSLQGESSGEIGVFRADNIGVYFHYDIQSANADFFYPSVCYSNIEQVSRFRRLLNGYEDIAILSPHMPSEFYRQDVDTLEVPYYLFRCSGDVYIRLYNYRRGVDSVEEWRLRHSSQVDPEEWTEFLIFKWSGATPPPRFFR